MPSLRAQRAAMVGAERLFHEGRLEECREATEDLLIGLSSITEGESDGDGTHINITTAHEAKPTPIEEEARHELFSGALVLLAGCYSAVGSLTEAERLLATCQGYIDEHIASVGSSATGPISAVDSIPGRANVALAVLAYNRGVARLEQYRTDAATPMAVVREADASFLAEAEQRLADVLGPARLLLADVCHSRGVCCEILAGQSITNSNSKHSGIPPPFSYLGALAYYQRSLDIRGRLSDGAAATELKLALTLEHVAHLLRLTATPTDGQQARLEALGLLEAVCEARRRLLGPGHSLSVAAMTGLGALAAELGRYKKSRRAFAAALPGALAAYPPGDSRVAEIEYWIARIS